MGTTPPIPPKIYRTTVTFIRDDTPTVYTLRLTLPEPMRFSPGQYVMVRHHHDGKITNKPYSVASSPLEEGYIDLCIKVVPGGPISNYLHALKPGAEVEILGPIGVFVLREDSPKDILFIAGGSGIGPLRSMLRYLFSKETTRHCWLFFGNKTKDEIIFHREFLEMAKQHANFRYIPVLSREQWDGEQGYVQHSIPRHITDFTNFEAYICGLTKLVEGNKAMLLGKGMDKHDVHHEVYV